ncbi:pyridine nucleotide-disulfide oxidoreductase [Kocuria rosea subsp. polaris]|uniref:Pyridine nucleotide-disulfide oxidoreductase n=1 Tax=Kocuria rosea subsp. polaris TaxID=136273 RepID=A0A0W8IPK9_KOCRO|nr:FAD-dependent oxidoreductase [Kocuria polaris]KUG61584.1 pyridine nucleotide-disulfide oxidoreductase [Kocuria polaris]
MESLVIVGASLAGLSAARAARSLGFAGRLVIIGDDPQRPYDRPPLSKDFLAGRLGIEDLALETDDEALEAEWVLGTRAASFDATTRLVHLEDGRSVRADGLVIATGASPRSLPQIAGAANVVSLRTLADAQKLRGLLAHGRRLVVVGAGFIGAEVASTAHALGLEVTVLEKSPTPLCGPLGTELGGAVAGLHERAGVELVCGVDIEDFELTGGSVSAVRLAGGRVLPADVVVVGIGAVPNTAWLEGSGIELGNGVLCDAVGATSIPGVVAVGDCAAWWDPRTGRHHRVEHWTGAAERPAVAVGALLGVDRAGLPAVKPPYFWSDQYGTRLQFAGDASRADRVAYEHGGPDQDSLLAVYYSGNEPVAVLAWNQTRLFCRWRKTLEKLALGAAQPVAA